MSDDNKNSIVNVIDEFDYSTQNDAYNEKFKKWRRNKDNHCAFNYSANKNEKVYIESKGFVAHSVEEAEKDSLTHIFYIIGIAALIWAVTEDAVSKLGISLLSLLGLNIHTNFFNSSVYGGSIEIVTALIAVSVLKIVVPSIYAHIRFKLPRKVEFMGRMNNSLALVGAISMTLIVCTAMSLPTAYSSESKEIYDYFRSIDADLYVWDQKEFLMYTIFDVIIMSVLSEMFFRGAMFAALRQFGDPFAIVMTALTAGLLTQDFRAMPITILVSLVAGYGMVSSGTMFTAISVSIVYKMYSLALLILETDRTEKMPLTRNIFMMIALAVGIVGFIVFWLGFVRRKKGGIARYSSEYSKWKRLGFSLKTFPYSAVLLICLAYAAMRLTQ
ncbi:MAG: CPBP family intramembrane metalloprotease [Ruminococcus sp.]|nr:CPBP family intramembrane metalloprotease [Ruminococcus sp.]MCR5014955.1 CPBP family intramembrane metalloprotease [Ruminococcus sp.]